MANTPPATVSDFKSRYDREFIYGSTVDKVRDKDVQNAIDDAMMAFNFGVWDGDGQRKAAFMLAVAHFLYLAIQRAGGLAGGGGLQAGGVGMISSKSVGQVSVSYALPTKLLDNPILSQFMLSAFGQQYLAMLAPRTVGTMFIAPGHTEY